MIVVHLLTRLTHSKPLPLAYNEHQTVNDLKNMIASKLKTQSLVFDFTSTQFGIDHRNYNCCCVVMLMEELGSFIQKLKGFKLLVRYETAIEMSIPTSQRVPVISIAFVSSSVHFETNDPRKAIIEPRTIILD